MGRFFAIHNGVIQRRCPSKSNHAQNAPPSALLYAAAPAVGFPLADEDAPFDATAPAIEPLVDAGKPGTGDGSMPQISVAYCPMVRSLLNLALVAV